MRLALCIAITLSLRAQQFTTTWSQGKCIDCKVAADLGSAQWVSHDEGWGIGFSFPPPGAQGAGDYVVVHTIDGGRSWRELPNTWQHAAPPAIWFLDATYGWFSCWNAYCTQETPGIEVRRTSDGGKHWEVVTRETAVLTMVFSDERNGLAQAFGVDDTGDMVHTSDGGATWSKIQIPQLKKITATTVLSGQIAWIVDLEGVDLLLFRTVDGGHAWDESRTALPSGWTNLHKIPFIDSLHGWIVLTHSGEAGEIHLLATNDGGHTWQPVPLPPSRNNDWWSPVVQFVSDQVGFVFLAEDGQHSVLFTADGGAHWRKYPLPYSISSCQALHGDLICTADRKYSHFGILTLHPK